MQSIESSPFALIPARDEAGRIGSVVLQTRKYLPVLVIDDASQDSTTAEALQAGAIVLIRPLSKGKGSSISTGLRILRNWNIKSVICLDGDGQHNPNFIPLFIKKAQAGFNIVLGNRMHEKRYMPCSRIISNSLTSLVISLFTQQLVRDSQCGYRLLSASALALEPTDAGFMYESEQLFLAARIGLHIGFIDITTIYRPGATMRFNIPKDIWTFLKIFGREILYRIGNQNWRRSTKRYAGDGT